MPPPAVATVPAPAERRSPRRSLRYSCRRIGRVLVLDGGVDAAALAAEAPFLVAELVRSGVLLPGLRVAHRDRTGAWTELLVADGRFTGLGALGSAPDC